MTFLHLMGALVESRSSLFSKELHPFVLTPEKINVFTEEGVTWTARLSSFGTLAFKMLGSSYEEHIEPFTSFVIFPN